MLKKLFYYGFVFLVLFFFIIQVVNLFNNGANRETLVVLSELLIFCWFILVYVTRKQVRFILHFIPMLSIRFVILGYLSCMFAETVYIFSKPLHKNLLVDVLLTTPWYLIWFLLWYTVLRRYRFSMKETFFLGGFHGFIVEGVLSGFLFANPLLALFSIPLFTVIYGCFFITPYIVLQQDFNSQKDISSIKKLAISFIPVLAIIPGAIWILFWVLVLGLQLH